MTIKERFDQFEDEFLKFERVENKFSNRADVHAFILLDKLVPGKDDILVDARHDEVFLSIGPEKLETASDEQIRDLIRCGIRLDDSEDGLAMFV